jgi:hypothetical protein
MASQSAFTLNAVTTQQYSTTQTLSTTGGSGGGGITYAVVGQSAAGVYTLAGAVLTANASSGWVDLAATKAADPNYNATTSPTVRVTFTTQTTTFTFTGGPFTYDGTAKSMTATANPSTATFTVSGQTATNAGDYTVSATANGNYSGAGSLPWTISKANQAALNLSASPTQVINSTQTLFTTGGTGAGAVTYSISTQTPAGTASIDPNSGVLTMLKSSGSVQVKATKAGDANYNFVDSSLVTVNAAPAPATFTFYGGPSFVQNGTLHTVTFTATPAAAATGASQTGTWNSTATGNYVATVTATGDYTGTASYAWKIISDPTVDTDSDGIPDVVEGQLGTNVNSGATNDSSNTTEAKIVKPEQK